MNANLFTKKIEMTKNEAKEAGKLNSEKFQELRQYMAMYPGYEVQIKAAPKRKTEWKGLDYKYMRAYIQKCDNENKAEIMEKFNTLIAQDKKDGKEGAEHLEAAGYLDVREWFLATFPEIRQNRQEHMEEHGCKHADGHWMTPEEVIALPEAQVIDLFNQIYGRG